MKPFSIFTRFPRRRVPEYGNIRDMGQSPAIVLVVEDDERACDLQHFFSESTDHQLKVIHPLANSRVYYFLLT